MQRRSTPRLVLAVTLAWLVAGCVPVEEGEGGFDASGPDTTSAPDAVSRPDATSDARLDGSEPTWPPAVEVATESASVGPTGGLASYFGGQLTIDFPPGALDDALELEVTRDLLTAGGEDLVGYTFGDHGYPVDPHATLVLTVPATWIPPGGAGSDTLGLYHVANDRLDVALTVDDIRVEDDRVRFTAEISRLDPFVIAAPAP
ncbi:MAG: hypothetical protein ACQEXJ_01310 [Myxococcota bacterium]